VCPSTIIITAKARSRSRKTILRGFIVASILSFGKGGLVSCDETNIEVAVRNPIYLRTAACSQESNVARWVWLFMPGVAL
jgi:hypothetical protein